MINATIEGYLQDKREKTFSQKAKGYQFQNVQLSVSDGEYVNSLMINAMDEAVDKLDDFDYGDYVKADVQLYTKYQDNGTYRNQFRLIDIVKIKGK
jgi:exosome complex RNA-binding protein Csl4